MHRFSNTPAASVSSFVCQILKTHHERIKEACKAVQGDVVVGIFWKMICSKNGIKRFRRTVKQRKFFASYRRKVAEKALQVSFT